MSFVDLSLDRLRRMQATLLRRVASRDAGNIHAVGFAPLDTGKADEVDGEVLPLTAQFDVGRKLADVPAAKRIERLEAIRLLDRGSMHYRNLSLITDVRECGRVVPTGVRVTRERGHATTSVVVRWTKIDPPPTPPADPDPDDRRWSWGVLTVSHLFAGESTRQAAEVERKVVCGGTPAAIGGRLEARGRIPGGPDVAVIETGLDRLWLSGFLKRADPPRIEPAGEGKLVRWTARGTTGSLLADDVSHRWTWGAYYPRFRVEGLGELSDVIRYEYTGEPADEPFGRGVSGAVLLSGGIPIGIQFAAAEPDFKVGYAQAFTASLPWLRKRLKATELSIVAVVGA